MKFKITLGLGLMILSGVWNQSQGQQLREAFRKVEQAVVIVRTAQKELAPYPQEGMVSLNGLGSGVLVSSDGKVITAAHLVQAADAIVVEFADGTVIPASVMGTSDSADVALLQLERPPLNLAPATLADSDQVAVGDEIFVVGAPYGLSHTLTAGHISGRYTVNRGVENTIVEFLQTDAAVNRGNSGSPLFSLNGELIGIVSRIMSNSGGSEGLAFAASSNTTRRLLLEQKPFWSGIEGLLVDGNLAKALKLLLMKADRVLDNPPYNLVIHSSPAQDPNNEHYHWHIEFMPKLTKTAGFEWGTGFYINPTPPEEAAKFLREASVEEPVPVAVR